MLKPFVAARLKLAHGNSHVNNLQKLIDEVVNPIAAGPIRAAVQIIPFPASVPLGLGDAIHNLRTALDLLAGDIVRLNGKSAADVYFPFCENADFLDQMIKRRKFHRASPEAVDLLKSMAPYKGGNTLLRALHDLDVMDKHQLIVPVSATTHVRGLSSTYSHGGYVSIPHANVPGVMRIAPGGVTTGTVETKVVFSQDAPAPLPGRRVIKTLQEMSEVVAKIIEDFAALSLRPPEAAPSAN